MPLLEERLQQEWVGLGIRIRDAEGRRAADGEDAKGAGALLDRDRIAAESLSVHMLDLRTRLQLEKGMRRMATDLRIQALCV